MATLWFILICFMLTMYVLLDGFDLGAGAIHLAAAKTDVERRMILQAIGPVWDGNEVWLIATGGTLFFTFPLLYASSFSGFYLSLMIVLWLLMLRGIAVELRRHVDNPLWASFWDGMFFLGSALLAVFFGVALANVVRGVPLDANGSFFEPLWTDFDPRSPTPGILDWYTVLIGLLALAALVMHGAHWIALKTDNPLNRRCRGIAHGAWIATILLTVAGTVATFSLRHTMLTRFIDHPLGCIFPMIAIGGLIAVGWYALRGQDRGRFFGSSAYLIGMLASTAFGLYPDVLPAVNPANSLTIDNAAAPRYGLVVGLVWWIIGMALAGVYFVIIYNLFRGKVQPEEPGY
jgi:cytochrome d ubiquinol oxidase subunit II